jgi:hypothetical protein
VNLFPHAGPIPDPALAPEGCGDPWGTGEVGWEWVWKEEGRRAGIFLPLRDWQGLGE